MCCENIGIVFFIIEKLNGNFFWTILWIFLSISFSTD